MRQPQIKLRWILSPMGTRRPKAKEVTFAELFGERLRETRERRGLTQEQLAAAVGTHGPKISAYEKGQTLPGLEKAARLATALEVGLDELVFGRAAEAPDDVRDSRLRASVRELEASTDRRLIDAAVTAIDGFVALARHEEFESRRAKRR
jgi:transcriptional regulator with XRE-family HTH domain